MATLYTTVVSVNGEGRNGGRVRSDDGVLETDLSHPKELGGAGTATNPEQLFAAGWGACFLGAVRRAAGDREVKLTSTAIDTEISLNKGDDGFSLSAVLNVQLGGVDKDVAVELADAAHQLCPYSKAIQGNVPVTINVTAV
ncbi:osmotically inducible protein OsmC [Streptomyces sp. AS58]|uniref:Organic hydroperoxide resistance protein n=1 Tax=Streptomyces cadmiisoli TaxID=2184053 RepID=A0A2Z4JEG3_9ACTN|nr:MULTISPECIES: organic hydroperoxide resistance protein [Streptomyces]AWW43456.1 organic hydroperoxide resistance protein [Streptomyces cadmiisoli]KOV50705.1 osmotically inducible protein OsmC [Streptomyces sp. AS58]